MRQNLGRVVHDEGENWPQEKSDDGHGDGSSDQRRDEPYDEFQSVKSEVSGVSMNHRVYDSNPRARMVYTKMAFRSPSC